jgi:hypothetical protein
MFGRSGRPLTALAATLLLASVISACGGGNGSSSSNSAADASPSAGSGEVVARVGATPITKTAINHWMAAQAANDYFELSGKQTIPEGLVSDPPRYATCVAHLEAAAVAAPRKSSQTSGVQLLTKCRQLYQALRYQTAGFLVNTLWVDGVAADLGITASDAEVRQFYRKSTAERYPRQVELSRYLASRRTNPANELVLIRKNLLAQRILAAVKAQGAAGPVALHRSEARWTAKTDCRPGYVVEHCKQFHGEPLHSAASPTGAVLIEQVAALATGRCVNLAACGKQ